MAYFTSWSGYRNYELSNIVNIQKLTHIHYAFANIDSSYNIVPGDTYIDTEKYFAGDSWDNSVQPYKGNYWQLLHIIKPQNPNLKIIISVGGPDSWSSKFSTMVSTQNSIDHFCSSVVTFLQKYPFDGIEIAWEYPVSGGSNSNAHSTNDAKNFINLINTLRTSLNSFQSYKSISIIVPTVPSLLQNYNLQNSNLLQMFNVLDYFNLMTLDSRGPWSTFTGHHSPLYAGTGDPIIDPESTLLSASEVVTYVINSGVPASKLNIAAAFYGRGWTGVTSSNNGLYQPFSGTAQGTWDNTGVFEYSDIQSRIQTGKIIRYWDDVAKAPWAYLNGLMISFDDTQSISQKTAFVKNNAIGGIFAWDLSGDRSGELTNLLITQLGSSTSGSVSSVSSSSSLVSSSSSKSSTSTSSKSSGSSSASSQINSSSFISQSSSVKQSSSSSFVHSSSSSKISASVSSSSVSNAPSSSKSSSSSAQVSSSAKSDSNSVSINIADVNGAPVQETSDPVINFLTPVSAASDTQSELPKPLFSMTNPLVLIVFTVLMLFASLAVGVLIRSSMKKNRPGYNISVHGNMNSQNSVIGNSTNTLNEVYEFDQEPERIMV